MRLRSWLISGLVLCVGFAIVGVLIADVHITGPVPGDRQWRPQPAQVADDGKLRIIVFGAHPDDAEIQAGGVAAMWAEQGHHVKFVSLTNGDIGHWRMAGGPLAQRRAAEVRKAAEVLGIDEVQVLDIHDGQLMPDLQTRHIVVGLIRQWKADIVIVHRPNDYHPDHRNSGLVVRDAAFMVTVPFYRPDVPYLETNPVFLYSYDRFQRPYPFQPDIVVGIDSVIQRKVNALALMESQFVEGGCCSDHIDPQSDQERAEGRERARQLFRGFFTATADRYRDRLTELYGPQQGGQIQYAQAFEIAEHGRQPSREELTTLFPFPGLRFNEPEPR